MRRRELAKYHNIAATTKSRGAGIGFAGVGVKIALLVCDEVLTETHAGRQHLATVWHLASRHRAPWKWTAPAGLLAGRGTAVRLRVTNRLSPLLDPGFVETVLRRQFRPLLDPRLSDMLSPRYPHGVSFVLNDHRLEPERGPSADEVPVFVRLGRRAAASTSRTGAPSRRRSRTSSRAGAMPRTPTIGRDGASRAPWSATWRPC
jgi:hypothetical protein